MENFEVVALAIGAGVIVLAVLIVLVFPKLGGDPNRADGTDSGMGP